MNPGFIKMALVLGLLSSVGPMAIDMYLPALPDITKALDTSTRVAQYTLMAYFVAFGACQILYGPTSDMFGRKPPLYFGLSLFTIASICCALAPTIEWLIIFRFFQGVGAAAVMSIPRAVIRDFYTGKQATRLLTTVMLVFSISPMLAPLIGSLLLVHFGWRSVFIGISIATFLSLLLAISTLPETLSKKNRVPFKLDALLGAFAVLLRDPIYLGLISIGGFGFSSFFAFLASASFLYMEYYGLHPTQFSLAFALNAISFFLSSQFAANFGSHFGPVRLVKWGVAGFALSSTVMYLLVTAGFDQFVLLMLMLMICNMFLGLVLPTVLILSLEQHGPIAGTASSLGGALQLSMGAVSIIIVSLIFDGTPEPLVRVIAVCSILALMVSIFVLRHVKNIVAD
ncbi:Bcr/CflA family drug resistance efflux transporter [Microbulbifer sp. A4B17]|uniref:multidrug effflux MFS transporter n=1 Tax=Microbulbifer sp. A4B17 TaxID=359370 RepID=UPI000D52D2C4|nr:multidrug effflux MFS transporter [Microbulbifer sp. A4B17]AWF80251.1 Bcr/CflA family drug resistance efflux transporter [Microbulbifer sp. A4B17]